jgi:tetratricopeptide (TPR) repeat protein
MIEADTITVEKYYEQLLENPDTKLFVNSLNSYINAVTAIHNFSLFKDSNEVFLHYPINHIYNFHYRKIIFRGLTDAEYDITSSAYRELKYNGSKKISKKLLERYHETLLEDAKNLNDEIVDRYKDDEIGLLAHLQHNGAKTFFIDYTYNPLVALWFACNSGNKDCCVVAIENRVDILHPINKDCKKIIELYNDENGVTKIFEPPSINRRIISQQSVLLVNLNGLIEKTKHEQIIIPADKKAYILEQLRVVGIHRKTLFPDFSGFIEWFKFDKNNEITDMIYEADVYHIHGNSPHAIELYQKALDFMPDDKLEADICDRIASCYASEYSDKALKWYKKALKIRENLPEQYQPDNAITYNNIGRIYYNKSKYHEALEWHLKAYKIFGNNTNSYKNLTKNRMRNAYEKYTDDKNFDKWLEERLNQQE